MRIPDVIVMSMLRWSYVPVVYALNRWAQSEPVHSHAKAFVSNAAPQCPSPDGNATPRLRGYYPNLGNSALACADNLGSMRSVVV